MRTLNKGENLTRDEIDEVFNNLHFTAHAALRMTERNCPRRSLPSIFKNPYSAFFNYDFTIIIAKDEFEYFVIKHSVENNKDVYIVLTFKEKSTKDVSVTRKQALSRLGIKYNFRSSTIKFR